jgi:hypothetical protein
VLAICGAAFNAWWLRAQCCRTFADANISRELISGQQEFAHC